jgi:hypothetical protein
MALLSDAVAFLTQQDHTVYLLRSSPSTGTKSKRLKGALPEYGYSFQLTSSRSVFNVKGEYVADTERHSINKNLRKKAEGRGQKEISINKYIIYGSLPISNQELYRAESAAKYKASLFQSHV